MCEGPNANQLFTGVKSVVRANEPNSRLTLRYIISHNCIYYVGGHGVGVFLVRITQGSTSPDDLVFVV